MYNLISIAVRVLLGFAVCSTELLAQADTTLPALLAGRLHSDSHAHRVAVARELLAIYSKLDKDLPNTAPNDVIAVGVTRREIKKFDATTEKLIDDARSAVNGINSSLLYIVDSSHHSLRREMISWVGVCTSLLDEHAFQCIAKLGSKGIVAVPRELASSNSRPPGSQSRKYARAIIEHFIGLYVFSVRAPE